MIPGRMARPVKVVLTSISLLGAALALGACGTQRISVPRAETAAYNGAVLFSQRCAGCHSLDQAGTHGSAANARTREVIQGPNFNVRCERPITRVLYAIENGGFSGAYMPQNIVLGHQARAVARFVAEYAGRKAASQPGTTPCVKQPFGALPAPGSASAPPAATTSTTPPPAATPTATPNSSGAGKPAAKQARPNARKRGAAGRKRGAAAGKRGAAAGKRGAAGRKRGAAGRKRGAAAGKRGAAARKRGAAARTKRGAAASYK